MLFNEIKKILNLSIVAREMHPPHPPGGRMHFMNYQLVRYIPLPPLFHFDKFNGN